MPQIPKPILKQEDKKCCSVVVMAKVCKLFTLKPHFSPCILYHGKKLDWLLSHYFLVCFHFRFFLFFVKEQILHGKLLEIRQPIFHYYVYTLTEFCWRKWNFIHFKNCHKFEKFEFGEKCSLGFSRQKIYLTGVIPPCGIRLCGPVKMLKFTLRPGFSQDLIRTADFDP